MVDVIAFPCIRPHAEMAREVASLPYDVFKLDEAKEEIKRHPHSFLRIDMAEATFAEEIDHNDDAVFEKSRQMLDEDIRDNIYISNPEPLYYLYRLTTPDGKSQTGLVGCVSIDDYQKGNIKKHEKTRADKEINRIKHVDICSAQTGPIFLTYRSNGMVEQVAEKISKQYPLYDFVADDGVGHTVWSIDDLVDAAVINQAFEQTDALYIADGHHRAASAVKAGFLRRKKAQKDSQNSVAGSFAEKSPLESDYFLSVIFPSDQLNILDYNRVVADLNGMDKQEFLSRVKECFYLSEPQNEPIKPQSKGSFGMYLDGFWYILSAKESFMSKDPVDGLDVSILQDKLLEPILGIQDPRSDERIDFVGGIRGLEELERRTKTDMKVAFSLFPTSIEELFEVADENLLMPPKSTWFEPKLRSGIFIHRI